MLSFVFVLLFGYYLVRFMQYVITYIVARLDDLNVCTLEIIVGVVYCFGSFVHLFHVLFQEIWFYSPDFVSNFVVVVVGSYYSCVVCRLKQFNASFLWAFSSQCKRERERERKRERAFFSPIHFTIWKWDVIGLHVSVSTWFVIYIITVWRCMLCRMYMSF